MSEEVTGTSNTEQKNGQQLEKVSEQNIEGGEEVEFISSTGVQPSTAVHLTDKGPESQSRNAANREQVKEADDEIDERVRRSAKRKRLQKEVRVHITKRI